MSFCATWVLFWFQWSIPPVPTAERSLVSQSFLRGRVGTFSSKVTRSHVQGIPLFWHQIVVAISFIQTSSLSKRQFWVQIIIIKVFILLQEKISLSPIHMSESVREERERERERERETERKRDREKERERQRALRTKEKQCRSVL